MEPILHHHDPSPFGEKIRLIFGVKALRWRSVQLPMTMPRPLLMPLTGGYRKVPVLQLGADIYCDTRLIVRVLEQRWPQPPVLQASGGLELALSGWSDRALFEPGAGLSMALNEALIPAEVIEDRKRFFNFMDFDRLQADIPHLHAQFRAGLDVLEDMLTDAHEFILGSQVSYADITAYFAVWMARGNMGIADQLLGGFPRLLAWERRMQAIGHGAREECSGEQALQVAAAAESGVEPYVDPADPLQLRVGQPVCVTPDDYGRIPVTGELLRLTCRDVAIARHSDEAGRVVVHFPRAGYRIDVTQAR